MHLVKIGVDLNVHLVPFNSFENMPLAHVCHNPVRFYFISEELGQLESTENKRCLRNAELLLSSQCEDTSSTQNLLPPLTSCLSL